MPYVFNKTFSIYIVINQFKSPFNIKCFKNEIINNNIVCNYKQNANCHKIKFNFQSCFSDNTT